VNLKNRPFRRNPATTATPHRRSQQAPQPPHAATAPTPTEVYAGRHQYRLDWPNHLRARAAAKREEADALNAQIQRDIALAARCCDEADDLERIAAVVELDQRSAFAPEPEPSVFPAAALVNGWQPEFDERDTVTLPQVQEASR